MAGFRKLNKPCPYGLKKIILCLPGFAALAGFILLGKSAWPSLLLVDESVEKP
jgi:hypothetical protein